MLAVRFREDYPLWPSSIWKNITESPDGYSELMTEEAYEQLLIDRLPGYEAWQEGQAAAQGLAVMSQKFVQVREAWQGIADRYAGSNSSTGITTAQAVAIADSFTTVEKYLRLNVPSKALLEIDNITPIEPFLPQARLTAMKAELYGNIQTIFGI